jgi:hypothetical protein
MAEHTKDEPGLEREAVRAHQCVARGLESFAIPHARRTDRLTPAAPEAGIEMIVESGVFG